MPSPFKSSEVKRALKAWLNEGISAYAARSDATWNDEDALCESFLSSIARTPLHTAKATVVVNSYKVRGRGGGAPEKKIGADGIGVVRLETPQLQASGFFLFQAKKCLKETDALGGVRQQAQKMLGFTAASTVMALMPERVVMVGAVPVAAASSDPCLQDVPYVGFAGFAAHVLLHGMMLDADLPRVLAEVLGKDQVQHVFTLAGSGADEPARARRIAAEIEAELAEFCDEVLPSSG